MSETTDKSRKAFLINLVMRRETSPDCFGVFLLPKNYQNEKHEISSLCTGIFNHFLCIGCRKATRDRYIHLPCNMRWSLLYILFNRHIFNQCSSFDGFRAIVAYGHIVFLEPMKFDSKEAK